MQDHIVQIRHLCEELLNKNVDIIKRSNMGKLVVLCMSSDSVNDRIRIETRQHGYGAMLALESHLLITFIDLKAQIAGIHLISTTHIMPKALRFMRRIAERAR